MSDNWIVLIPEDPQFVPDAIRQVHARAWFERIVPDVEEIEFYAGDTIEFFDCGANFKNVLCPNCRRKIALEWWQQRMEEDYDQGFKLLKYPTPCCSAICTLHDLIYDWPQGFGRFALDATNPGIGKLDEAQQREIEAILGTPLRVIYQHI